MLRELPLLQDAIPLLPARAPVAAEPVVVVQPAPPQLAPLQPDPAPASAMTTADLIRPDGRLRHAIEGFLIDQRSEHTRRAYGKDLKRFLQFLHGRHAGFGPEAMTRLVIIAYKEFLLADGLSQVSVDRHLATLKSFFRWLVDDGFMDKNPAEGVRFLNPKKLSATSGFSDEEVIKILSIPDLHTRVGSLHYALLIVLFQCGLRRSELCAIRLSHLSVERGNQVLRLQGKGNKERIMVLIPPVWAAIRHYLTISRKSLMQLGATAGEADQPLFTPARNSRTGTLDKPLDPSQVYYIVRRYARLAGIARRVSPHSCRATAISNARDHHVPDRVIMEFAGWSSTEMITRYDKRKAAVEDSAAHSIQYGAPDRVPAKEALHPLEQDVHSPLDDDEAKP